MGNPTGTRSDGKALNDLYPVGTTTITWSVTDNNGNAAITVDQKIIIEDKEKPIAPELPNVLWGCSYTVEIPTASDNCSGVVTATADRSTTFDTSGTITWTFTDDAGNTSIASQTITIDPLTIAEETTPVSCNGGSDGSITLSASGGNQGYKYKIEGGTYTNSNSFKSLSKGNYIVYIKDSKGCETSKTVSITEPEELQISSPSKVTNVTCFDGDDGKIEVGQITGGNPPYQYSLDNNKFGNSMIFENLPADSYTIFVKDAKGCALQEFIDVKQPGQLKADINKKDITCYGAKDGEISLTGLAGGSGSYEYSIDGSKWVNGTQEINIESPGTYEVQLRDHNQPDCKVALGSVSVSEPQQLIVEEVIKTNTTEYGTPTGTASASASGGIPGYFYKWQKLEGENTWNNLSQQSKSINNLTAGNYRVIVTDQNGCSTEPYGFTIIDKITANISIFSSCNDSTNDIRISEFNVMPGSVMGGLGDETSYRYKWDFGTNAKTGSVKVIKTPGGTPVDINAPFIGDNDDVFIVPYNKIGSQTVTLTVIDDNTNPSTENKITFNHLVNSCFTECGNANDIDVSIDNFFIGEKISEGVFQEVQNCEENTSQLYLVAQFKTSTTTKLSVEMEYTLTPPNGTSEVYSVDIVHNVNLNKIDYFPIFKIGDGVDDIQWTCGDDFEIIFASFDWDKPGKGNSGQPHCLGVNVQVPVPTPLKATAVPTHIDCFGDATGSIAVSVSGGSGNYVLSAKHEDGTVFQPTQNTKTFHNLPAGNYEVSVADGKYEDIILNIEILQPEAISAKVTSSDPVCYADPETNNFTGHAVVSEVTGGTSPYNYSWNNGESKQEVDLLPGDYTVTITDSNSCSLTLPVNINQPPKLTEAQVGEDQSFGCGFTSTILTGNTPEVGTGKWTITSGEGGIITNDLDSKSAFNGKAGENYTLTWTIANADGTCATSKDLSITFAPDCSTLDFDGVDDYITFGDNYDLSSGTFTLEAWIRPKSISGIQTILSKRNSSNISSGGYDLIINNGAPTFRWNGNSVSTSYKVGTNRWYHLAVINSGSQIELYVDGIKVGNRTASSPTAISSPFLIGAMHSAATPDVPANYYKGWIEEVRIWDTALTIKQLRFMMNQRIENNNGMVKGEIMPKNVPENLSWSRLSGYYRLIATEIEEDGTTLDRASNSLPGYLKNIESLQQNTAPLPYISEANGEWKTRTAWDTNIGAEGDNFWTWPNDIGINGSSIDWNIASQSHTINSGNKNITLLGLFINGGNLNMLGTNPTRSSSGASTAGSGNGLTITHHLKLDGTIDLNGESQLVQPEGSEITGSGSLERDQQGTASSYNYNYFSSPVSNGTSNSGYTIDAVLRDGTDPNTPKIIDFNPQFHWADHGHHSPIRLSTYWMNNFFGQANTYSAWSWIGKDGNLNTGEGFTLKGSGEGSILELQNYTFKGMPNNGTISLKINTGQNYLVGNPYPSAIDADEFIKDNLGGRRSGQNVFNGSLYFWSHFSGYTHYLENYVGGYAVYNLSGGIRAIANDARINATGDKGGEVPQQFIPVGQAFFVNSVLDEGITNGYNNPVTIQGGDILFKNSQRIFVTESDKNNSVFHTAERKDRKMAFSEDNFAAGSDSSSIAEKRQRFWIEFKSPAGYLRQLLVTKDPEATSGFDLGFDAPLNENNLEDMYWLINDHEFVIQGVPDFGKERVLPLGIKISEEGDFSIAIDELENIPDDLNIYVRDSLNNIYHNLRDSDFSATAAIGEDHEKYAIVFNIPEETPDPDEGDIDTEEPGDSGEEDGDSENPGDTGDSDEGDGESDGENPEDGEVEGPGTAIDGTMMLFYSITEKAVIIHNPDLLNIEEAVLFNGIGQELQHISLNSSEAKIPIIIQVPNTGVYFIRVYYSAGTKSLKFLVE
ncbi:MAG: LamG-like jellyroll fold domain-containing protein [Salinimicrobium sp.]